MVAPISIWDVSGVKHPPRTVLVPAYGDAAYRAGTALEPPYTAASIANLVGRPVWIDAGYKKPQVGALLLRGGGGYTIVNSSRVSYGSASGGLSSVKKLAPLELKPNARLADEVTYTTQLARERHQVIDVKVKGAVATFLVEAPHDGRAPALETARDLLRMVAWPLFDDTEWFPNGRSPLGKAALAAVKARGLVDQDERYEVADELVTSFTIEKPAKKPFLRGLDKLTIARAKALFEAPGPTYVVKVTMTRPEFAAHLTKAKLPYGLDAYPL